MSTPNSQVQPYPPGYPTGVASNPWGRSMPGATVPRWNMPAAPSPARYAQPAAAPGYPPAPAPGYPPAPAPGYPPAGYPQPVAAPGYLPAGYARPGAYPAYQYGQPGYPGAYPTRRSGSGRVVIGILLVPAVLFLLFLIVTLMSTSSDEVEPPIVTPPTQTTGGDNPPPPPVDPPPGGFMNDDYQVGQPNLNPPRLPFPGSDNQAYDWMERNAIYDQPIPAPVRCQVTPVDPSTASKAEVETYLNGVMECMLRVWGPELEQAGFHAPRPSVTVYSSQIQTPCGKSTPSNAYYCTADQQIYYSLDLAKAFPKQQHDPLTAVAIIAHEFGHAIQGLSGILLAEMAFEDYYENHDDQPAANLMSRRAEVQADCLAGAFFQAITQSVDITGDRQESIANIFYLIGDDVLSGDPNHDGNHGQGKNRQSWFTVGLTAGSIGSCNSFDREIPESKLR